MNKNKFKHGMYGGKFLPFHKGHQHCIKKASKMCNRLTVVLFINGDDELRVMSQPTVISKEELSVGSRVAAIKKFIGHFRNVDFVTVDCKKVYETLPTIPHWDAETPFIQAIISDMDAVFSSEPDYDGYFKRAYPNAKHVMIDPLRIEVPISATAIRNMSDKEGRKLR